MDMIASLAQRQLEGELMDDPGVDAHVHVAALRGLRRINRVSRTAAALWPPLVRIAGARRGGALSLLDIATGGGDAAISLWWRARRRGLALHVDACDISRTALRFAASGAARAGAPVRFFRLDVLSEPPPARYDVITATLFLHHLTDAQIVALLRTLAAHADHLLISDLIRSRAGYCLASIGTRLLSGSPIVHTDGLRSVRAALTVPEARALAAQRRGVKS
jgi:2-polyprenyl-3-methyl-5-hydroxy-6-metoxy-1,4-benzoquinol methylase